MTTKPTKLTLAAIHHAVSASRRVYCRLGPQIETLDPQERRDYRTAMEDHAIPMPVILRVLTARGVRTNHTTLQEHRRGMCPTCGTGGR